MAVQRKTWSPFTRLVWLVFVVGIAVQWPAGRVIIGIIGGLIVVSVIVALVYGFAHRNDAPSARRSTENETLDRIVASWKD